MSLKKLFPGRRGHGGICILGPTPSGRMILDNFRANGREVDCFVDPQGKFRGDFWAGLPVVKLEGQAQLPRLKRMGIRQFVVVSGAAVSRRRLYRACMEAGLTPAVLTHPTAMVLQDVKIGAGCVIGARALLGVGTVLEDNCLVGMGSLLDHDCVIGCHGTIGAGTTLGAGTHLEEGAFIGDGVVILPGRRIGAGAIVVSGSVVTQDIPPGAIAAGTSARLVRRGRSEDGG